MLWSEDWDGVLSCPWDYLLVGIYGTNGISSEVDNETNNEWTENTWPLIGELCLLVFFF